MEIVSSSLPVVLNALIPGNSDSGTKLDFVYLEFANGLSTVTLPNPSDVISVDYFQQLGATAERDYVRCPVTYHQVLGNGTNDPYRLKLTVISQETTGFHGKPFSSASASLVYGVAVVASQTQGRPDLLFARHYLDAADQLPKYDSSSFVCTFCLRLALP